jgi:hypothetical protein
MALEHEPVSFRAASEDCQRIGSARAFGQQKQLCPDSGSWL